MTGRDRKIIVIVAALALVVGSWLLVISPKRDQASKLGDQVGAAQAALATARSQVAAGEAAKGTFARDYTVIAQLGEAVPTDDNVPSLIYQVQNAASDAGVDFRVLKLVPGSSATAAAAPAAATPAPGGAVPPGSPVAPGFPTLPFTFTFVGNFFHLADFFALLQRFVVASSKHVSVSGRLMTITSISLAPASSGFPQISATVSATAYLVPAAPGLLNGATPAGPAVGAAAQPVSTPAAPVPASPAVITEPAR